MEITRRAMLGSAALLAAAPRALAQAGVSASARGLYKRAIVIDALGAPGGYDPAEPDADGFTRGNLADIRSSGLTAVNLTVGQVGNVPDAYEATIRQLAQWEDGFVRYADVLMPVRRIADLQAAKRSGRLGLIFGFQDTTPLGTNLDRLEQFDDFGVKIIQPVYNRRNLMGDGCLEPGNSGLSRLGQDLVSELNRRRIVVDLSHAGVRTQTDAVAASTRPPVVSHTGCRALVDNPRNTHDSVIRAVADKGGVIGIYFMPFLRQSGQPRGADLIAHIEYAWNVAGEDHVGLGTDGSISAFVVTPEVAKQHADAVKQRVAKGIAAPGEAADAFTYVPDYNGPRKFERLADDLLARGHSATRVEKLLGANFARVFGEVWG